MADLLPALTTFLRPWHGSAHVSSDGTDTFVVFEVPDPHGLGDAHPVCAALDAAGYARTCGLTADGWYHADVCGEVSG